jgi:hypothetical protein
MPMFVSRRPKVDFERIKVSSLMSCANLALFLARFPRRHARRHLLLGGRLMKFRHDGVRGS